MVARLAPVKSLARVQSGSLRKVASDVLKSCPPTLMHTTLWLLVPMSPCLGYITVSKKLCCPRKAWLPPASQADLLHGRLIVYSQAVK